MKDDEDKVCYECGGSGYIVWDVFTDDEHEETCESCDGSGTRLF